MKFRVGDTITNGQTYVTIIQITRSHYKLHGYKPAYMPIALVDRFWTLADETEIED